MFVRILVPVDYSPCSRASAEYALRLAAKAGAAVDVVHVWDKPTYVSDAVMVRRPNEEHRSLSDLIRENAEADMKTFMAELTVPSGVTVGQRLVSGEPVSALLAELKKGEHDLVVIGTHGRTGLAHVLLGSVTERLIRMSPVPVLTVPSTGRS
jgi:nucleotide-binding universal stress UspA family protein